MMGPLMEVKSHSCCNDDWMVAPTDIMLRLTRCKIGYGTCYGQGGVNGWLCTHRWPAIVGMVAFRNHVFGSAVDNYVTGTSQQVAFGRGSLGFVAINNADSAWSRTFSTSLPDGSYCDVCAGTPSGITCAGAMYVYLRLVNAETVVFLKWSFPSVVGILCRVDASQPLYQHARVLRSTREHSPLERNTV
jgi:hypothetical protein